MYRNILIATDGSKLAEKAVSHGVSLAKLAGAKVTALIVEASFSVYEVPESQIRQMSEAFAQHSKHAKEHATKVLSHVADVAKAAGVTCEAIQIEDEHPYKAIIKTAEDKGCDRSNAPSSLALILCSFFIASSPISPANASSIAI